MKFFANIVVFTSFFTVFYASSAVFITAKEACELIVYPAKNAPAEVVALNVSKIPSELSARLVSLKVIVGDIVKKDQVLAELDCEQHNLLFNVEQARYQQLSHQVAFQENELIRGNKLFKQRNIGEAELDLRKVTMQNVNAQLVAQQASLSLAELNVSHCHIKAPFAGVVTQRLSNEGEMILVGEAVVELLQQNNNEISANIPLSDTTSFNNAASYQLMIGDISYPLSFRAMLPLVKEHSGSREVRLVFNANAVNHNAINKNKNIELIPGEIGRLTWQSPTAFLPAHLLQSRQDTNGFFVIENNRARFIKVPKAEEGRPIPYYLDHKQLIIVEGRHGLVDSDELKITPTAN
jgi:RND family efflux transporter MFP subunit